MFLQREAHLDTVCPKGIRTLHYYDRIGLLHPTKVTEAGYRLYDDTTLERLQCIMLLKEMEFPLKEIGRILESPDSVRNMALEQQIRLQEFISEHYYTCSKEILSSLGRMYAGGGSFTENIDQAGGEGTAEFAHRAIEAYCGE